MLNHLAETLQRFDGVLGEGTSCLPNTLFAHQSDLHLNPTQFNLVLQLFSVWWDSWPHPPIRAIAFRMGRSERCIQMNLRKLARPLLDAEGVEVRPALLEVRPRRTERGDSDTNEYDLSPLLAYLSHVVTGKPLAECQQPLLHGEAADSRPASIDFTTFTEEAIEALPVEPEETRRVPAPPLPSELDSTIEKLSKEFGDYAHVKSNKSRLSRLFVNAQPYGMDESLCLAMMDEVAAATREAKIKKRNADGRKNRMPYFFGLLTQCFERYCTRRSKEVEAEREFEQHHLISKAFRLMPREAQLQYEQSNFDERIIAPYIEQVRRRDEENRRQWQEEAQYAAR